MVYWIRTAEMVLERTLFASTLIRIFVGILIRILISILVMIFFSIGLGPWSTAPGRRKSSSSSVNPSLSPLLSDFLPECICSWNVVSDHWFNVQDYPGAGLQSGILVAWNRTIRCSVSPRIWVLQTSKLWVSGDSAKWLEKNWADSLRSTFEWTQEQMGHPV